MVVLCTAAAYWFYDMLDEKRGRQRLQKHISRNWLLLMRWLGIALFLMAAGVLATRGSAAVRSLLILLGGVTVGFCCVSGFVRAATRRSIPWLWLRAMLVGLIWTLATVLIPVLDAGEPIRPQVYMAVAFVWQMMFVVAAMWSAGEHGTPLGPSNSGLLSRSLTRTFLIGLCAFSSAMVVVGVILGYFPWKNVALLAACASNACFLLIWRVFCEMDRRVFCDFMILMNMAACYLTIGAYSMKVNQPGPVSVFDWFQIFALGAFFANILVRVVRLPPGDRLEALAPRGQTLDLVFLLGLGIFVFQVLLRAMHLELGLFPALHMSLFASTAASIAGALLVLAGVLLQALAYSAMGASWRLGIDSKTPRELVISGPFAVTRNPIYLGFEFYVAGTFLINPAPVFLLLLMLVPVFVHLQILREERFLSKAHGRQYDSYAGETPRYISLRQGS
jgi:protein-S-isoprenylcysteine O-methyltransferase Ste14